MEENRVVENEHPKSVVDWITAIDLGDTIVTAPSTLGGSAFSLELAKVKDLNGCILHWKYGHLSFDFIYNKFEVSIVSKSHSCHFSILHLQILMWMLSDKINPKYASRAGRSTYSVQQQIKLVLDNGGSTGLEIKSVAVCIKQDNLGPIHLDVTNATPLEFIFSVINTRVCNWYHKNDRLDPNVKDLVDMIEKSNRIPGVHEGPEPLRNPPRCFSHLLYSKELSDMTFACNGRTAIPAHKVLLAGASPYFQTFFAGPWDQQNPDGNWKTTFDADILKIVLRYIYEGKMDDDDPGSMGVEVLLKVLQVGQEFQMANLVHDCCKILRTKINVDNIKSLICVAWTVLPPIAGSTNLWKHCVYFIKDRWDDILMDPDFFVLANEHKDLWRDLQREISSRKWN